MYLKNIEIHGFKSFANKMIFEFHNGITGIVGPNGSGKSNVADAVRWVLGEQKVKQLRGANMQDVIFAGTENRKALGFAYVAITLDNSDHKLPIEFEEVKVARRIYRSGESEYLLNGRACRLKDINELFYDTGIGKEGYSIIGQGQIDKILSGKPEERRELFDEAAGIVKFKRRKNSAQKKLEAEQQNLVRVNDILTELEKDIGPLEKQAETAREYLKKKEELKRYDINMFLLGTGQTQTRQGEIQAAYDTASHQLQQTEQQYQQSRKRNEELDEQIENIQEEIEGYKKQLNDSNMLKKQLETQIEVLREQINTDRLNDEHLQNRTSILQEELQERCTQRAQLAGERDQIQKQLDQAKAADQAARAQLDNIQLQVEESGRNIEAKKNEIIRLLNEQVNTKSKQQRYDTMLEQVSLRKTEMNQRFLKLKSDDSEQEEQLQQYEADKRQIDEAIAGLQEENQQCEQEIVRLQEQLTAQSRQVSIGQTAFHREQSRLESLKNITERYDGYGNSIRKVMERKEHSPGLIGVVADIIKVEKEYEIAIETALGGSIQNIVTDTEDTAKKTIAYLKANKFGRATFLPLTSVKRRQKFSNMAALKEPGVIGLADTLVTTASEYKELAGYLLGRTVVVKTIDDGVALAKKYNYTLRIVTLEGESLNPGGSMTGGAFRNSSNLLGRRREIEEFEQSVKQLEKELADMQQAMELTKQKRTSCYARMDEIKESIQEKMISQNMAAMNISQVKERQDEAKQTYESLELEGRQIGEQIIEIKSQIARIQEESAAFDTSKEQLEAQIAVEQQLLDQQREEENEALKKSEQVHLELANLSQNYSFAVQNAERIEEETGLREEELQSLSGRIKETAESIQKKERDIEELVKTIAQSGDVFEEIETQIDESTRRKEQLTKERSQSYQMREDLAEQKNALDKEVYRLNSQLEKLEEDKEKQIQYMWEEYELTYHAALELRDEELQDIGVMKKTIAVLKEDIRKLGNVNVNAIEDYKEKSERFEFLAGQRDDLIEAEEALEKIIDELDRGMKAQFEEKFQEIAREFDKVFKELFGGGKGTLELMADEDILEAGISIIAQPPGKKLQNMMQLSGGEKALTAIALLFAIQNLKPSPFCLLDEIEAALDESNVDRYAGYLHKLTKHTQFIIITHRRGTMAAADRLYGITMQEKGVSTQVSVNLIEDDLDQ